MTAKTAPRSVDVEIVRVSPLKPSDQGNPRYAFHAADGREFRTRANTVTAAAIAPHFPQRARLTLDARAAVTEIRYH